MNALSVMHYVQNSNTQVILSTTLLFVEDDEGNQQICRAILDQGSQSNLITESLVKRFKLKVKQQK